MSASRHLVSTLLLVLLGFGAPFSALASDHVDIEGSLWRVTLDTHSFGPIELNLGFGLTADDSLCGRSFSGALEEIRPLAAGADAETNVDGSLFEILVRPSGTGYQGELRAPWPGATVVLSIDHDTLDGRIEGGLLTGTLTGSRLDRIEPLRDYATLATELGRVVAAKIFDPTVLDGASWDRFQRRFVRIAATAVDDLDLLLGFHFASAEAPFSHFDLRRSEASAESMISAFDSFEVGYEAARPRARRGHRSPDDRHHDGQRHHRADP